MSQKKNKITSVIIKTSVCIHGWLETVLFADIIRYVKWRVLPQIPAYSPGSVKDKTSRNHSRQPWDIFLMRKIGYRRGHTICSS